MQGTERCHYRNNNQKGSPVKNLLCFFLMFLIGCEAITGLNEEKTLSISKIKIEESDLPDDHKLDTHTVKPIAPPEATTDEQFISRKDGYALSIRYFEFPSSTMAKFYVSKLWGWNPPEGQSKLTVPLANIENGLYIKRQNYVYTGFRIKNICIWIEGYVPKNQHIQVANIIINKARQQV